MIEIGEVKKNTKLLIEGFPCSVIDFEHVKPGKGSSFTRCRYKNLVTSQLFEKTFKSNEKFEEPNIEHKTMQFLYGEAAMLYFMDMENYEQTIVPESLVGDQKAFLQENMECGILFFNEKPIQVELPIFVNLAIKYCEPGFKGDTATGGTKPATLVGGHVAKVPLHLKEGDVLKIDTRTGDYVEKVNK